MSVPTWIGVVLDAPRTRFDDAVAFWSAVTGWTAAAGDEGDRRVVTLLPPSGAPWVSVRAVDDGPGLHLDVAGTDPGALRSRALDLGAVAEPTPDDAPALRSPGGLPLGVGPAPDDPRLTRTGADVLDQVCLDIPEHAWESEIAFWHALTGRELASGRFDHFRRLVDPDPAAPVRFLLQRTDDDRAAVGAHPDLAVTDRPAQTARHVDLGATVLATHEAWTVLRAPDGLVYCLTDRDPRTGLVRTA